MSKVAVVYWSGTGNTEAMANAVLEGAKAAGADASIFTASEFDGSRVAEFDGIAFGCPAMGAEVLEESEFEPMFNSCESSLSGKKLALFGSYGWGGSLQGSGRGAGVIPRNCVIFLPKKCRTAAAGRWKSLPTAAVFSGNPLR